MANRLIRSTSKLLIVLGLPLVVIMCLGVVVEISHPDFRLGAVLDPLTFPRFVGNVLLNSTPSWMALVAAFLIGAWYMDSVFRLGGVASALEHILGNMFQQASTHPRLVIKNGKIDDKPDTVLARVGGPGMLVVFNDSAVVTEQAGRLKRIVGPGRTQLEPFEHIWSVVDLRPQHWVHPVSALTQDGIPVSCEVDITFRIDDRTPDGPAAPTPETPHPFAPDAVLRASAACWMRESTHTYPMVDWAGRAVTVSADGAMRTLLRQYRLDELIRPEEPTGRNTIRQRIREGLQAILKDSMRQIGVRLLDADIGTISIEISMPQGEETAAEELEDQVVSQWIRNWQAQLERAELEQRAEGEAQLANLETVSVQAQAEMILNLAEAVQSLVGSEEISAYRIALRLVETLRWMSMDPKVRSYMLPDSLESLNDVQRLIKSPDSPAQTNPT
ncbi:MAG: hypothetical protein GX620_04315 [Chloroflexi bacterium]|nr:hypothetical protein [Chloroflexota bacterium]